MSCAPVSEAPLLQCWVPVHDIIYEAPWLWEIYLDGALHSGRSPATVIPAFCPLHDTDSFCDMSPLFWCSVSRQTEKHWAKWPQTELWICQPSLIFPPPRWFCQEFCDIEIPEGQQGRAVWQILIFPWGSINTNGKWGSNKNTGQSMVSVF